MSPASCCDPESLTQRSSWSCFHLNIRILQPFTAGTNILLLHTVTSQRAQPACSRQPPASTRSAPTSRITFQQPRRSEQTGNAIGSFRSSLTFRQFDSFPSLTAEVESAGECDHVTRKPLPQAHTCLISLFVTCRMSFCLPKFHSDTTEIYYLCKKKKKSSQCSIINVSLQKWDRNRKDKILLMNLKETDERQCLQSTTRHQK